MPSGVSREPPTSFFGFLGMVSMLLFVAALPFIVPISWSLYWARFPGPAPRTPSALVDNPAMAQAVLPLDAGLMALQCAPHGKNPDYGWTCVAQRVNVGQPVTVQVNHFPSPMDETLYHAGLSFTMARTMNDGATSDDPVDWGGHLRVALSVDPSMASFEATASTISTVADLAWEQLQIQQNQAMAARIDADKARAAAEDARKTPLERAHENLDTWKHAADAASPASGA